METTLLKKQSFAKLLKGPPSNYEPLKYLLLFSLACLALAILGMAFDHRLISGELAWIKPIKFSVSLALYAGSLIWMGQYLTNHKRLFQITCNAALGGSVVELAAIIMQTLRGAQSHFNTLTPLDSFMWCTIQLAIVPVSVALLVLFILLLKQENLPRPLSTAMRFAVLLSIFGLVPGVLMIMPDSLQNIVTGQRQLEGHIVGSASACSGLPFLGWSTVAGDLRVAHFVGLHALQVIPLATYALFKLFPWLTYGKQRLMVWNLSLTYLSLQSLLMWQALHAESIVRPSDTTIAMAAAILFCYLLFVALALLPLGQFTTTATLPVEAKPLTYICGRSLLDSAVAETPAAYSYPLSTTNRQSS
jgi:hypothetical protein